MNTSKLHYIVIPLVVIAVAVLGSSFTSVGLDSGWYDSIAKPEWTPPGYIIGIAWTTIYILSAMSAIMIWNRSENDLRLSVIAVLFLLNAMLNVFWSYLFFDLHELTMAGYDSFLLGTTVIALIVFSWPISKIASLLLVPYAGWVTFATYLTFLVAALN